MLIYRHTDAFLTVRRCPTATLGVAAAAGLPLVTSYGRLHTPIECACTPQKKACFGVIYGRLSSRNYDISGLKSSFIPPVRSLEA